MTYRRCCVAAAAAVLLAGCGSTPRERLLRAARELDKVAQYNEEWGTIAISGPFISTPAKENAFNLAIEDRELFERTRTEGAARAAQLRALFVKFAAEAKAPGADDTAAQPPSLPKDDPAREAVGDFTDVLAPFQGDIGMSQRRRIRLTASDRAEINLHKFFSFPTNLAEGHRAYFLSFTVACTPGWRTREGYVGNVDVRLEYSIGQEPIDVIYENPGSTHPHVGALYPAFDSQELNLRSSYRQMISVAAQLAGANQIAGATAFLNAASRLERDTETATGLAQVTSYSQSGRNFGYEFRPAFRALAQPGSGKTETGYRLESLSFPAVAVILVDKNHVARLVQNHRKGLQAVKKNPQLLNWLRSNVQAKYETEAAAPKKRIGELNYAERALKTARKPVPPELPAERTEQAGKLQKLTEAYGFTMLLLDTMGLQVRLRADMLAIGGEADGLDATLAKSARADDWVWPKRSREELDRQSKALGKLVDRLASSLDTYRKDLVTLSVRASGGSGLSAQAGTVSRIVAYQKSLTVCAREVARIRAGFLSHRRQLHAMIRRQPSDLASRRREMAKYFPPIKTVTDQASKSLDGVCPLDRLLTLPDGERNKLVEQLAAMVSLRFEITHSWQPVDKPAFDGWPLLGELGRALKKRRDHDRHIRQALRLSDVRRSISALGDDTTIKASRKVLANRWNALEAQLADLSPSLRFPLADPPGPDPLTITGVVPRSGYVGEEETFVLSGKGLPKPGVDGDVTILLRGKPFTPPPGAPPALTVTTLVPGKALAVTVPKQWFASPQAGLVFEVTAGRASKRSPTVQFVSRGATAVIEKKNGKTTLTAPEGHLDNLIETQKPVPPQPKEKKP